MINVAILTYSGSALFETACAVELFGLERPEFKGWYQTEVITFENGILESTCNVGLTVRQISSLASYDMLIVPSWPTESQETLPRLTEQILTFHQAKKTIISFCSGAFLLAELGLLDGEQATTHWRYATTFKQRFHSVKYVDDVLYILDDKPLGGTVGTSAGSAAGIDLGLEIIRRDFGSSIANHVAKRLVMSPHRKGGQSQFVEPNIKREPSVFENTLNWALENLTTDISIDDLAAKSHMSRRTFDRHFRNSHGCSAKQWLINQRVNLAKTTLEQSKASIERIACVSGFESANTLRHHFRKNLGVSPRQYRDQFSSLTNHAH